MFNVLHGSRGNCTQKFEHVLYMYTVIKLSNCIRATCSKLSVKLRYDILTLEGHKDFLIVFDQLLKKHNGLTVHYWQN